MLKGAAEYAQGSQQNMTIFLSAVPSNSDLLIRIVETPAPVVVASSTPTPASSNVSFVMNVQRADVASSEPTSLGVFGTVVPPVLTGSLLIAYGSVAVPGVQSSLGLSLDTTAPDSASSDLGGIQTPAAASPVASERLTTLVDDAPPGISVGPLVAMGSAPLRPPLGTTTGDPTPPIDRNEHSV